MKNELFELSPAEFWVWAYLYFLAAEQQTWKIKVPGKDGRRPHTDRHFRKILNNLKARGKLVRLEMPKGKGGQIEILLAARTDPQFNFQGIKNPGINDRVEPATRSLKTELPIKTNKIPPQPGHTGPGSKQPGHTGPSSAARKTHENKHLTPPPTDGTLSAKLCFCSSFLKELVQMRDQGAIKGKILSLRPGERREIYLETARLIRLPKRARAGEEAIIYGAIRALQTKGLKNPTGFILTLAEREEESMNAMAREQEDRAWKDQSRAEQLYRVSANQR